MSHYKAVWVRDYSEEMDGDVQTAEHVTAFMNDMAADDWQVHSVVPSTGANKQSGLLITFVR